MTPLTIAKPMLLSFGSIISIMLVLHSWSTSSAPDPVTRDEIENMFDGAMTPASVASGISVNVDGSVSDGEDEEDAETASIHSHSTDGGKNTQNYSRFSLGESWFN